jgi:hypothetical protein
MRDDCADICLLLLQYKTLAKVVMRKKKPQWRKLMSSRACSPRGKGAPPPPEQIAASVNSEVFFFFVK